MTTCQVCGYGSEAHQDDEVDYSPNPEVARPIYPFPAEAQQDDSCSTPGCPGDPRYAAPGRGHAQGCRHPFPAEALRDRVIEALIDADGAYSVRDMDGPGYFEVMADAALAARPPADTEPSPLPPVPYEQHEREVLAVIAERDYLEDIADRLAAAIAPPEVLGEHSSGNNPWLKALDYAEGGGRTSADTETLRRVRELADRWDALDMGTGRYPEDSAHRSAHEDRAQACAEELRAALDGTQ